MARRCILLILLTCLVCACGHHLYHRVERGETLYSVSWLYGYDYKTVANWNGIAAPYHINEGQILHLAPQKREVERKLLTKSYEVQSSQPSKQINSSTNSLPRTRSTSANSVQPPPVHQRSQNTKSGDNYSQPKLAKVVPNDVIQNKKLLWRWPAHGRVVSDFKTSKGKYKGLEIKGNLGQTVRAAAQGKVVYSGNSLKGYGNLVIIKHTDEYLSAYAHNRDLFVSEGEYVVGGQKIAEMGNTDKEDVSLYFEIRKDGKPVNPYWYLPKKK